VIEALNSLPPIESINTYILKEAKLLGFNKQLSYCASISVTVNSILLH
jgi:hypothetical protein